MKLLGLDQATNILGYAIFDDGELTHYGALDFSSGTTPAAKISMIRHWLKETIAEHEIEVMGMEDTQLQQNPQIFKTLSQLLGVVENVAYESGLQYYVVKSASWKSTCGIKGRQRAEQKRSAQAHILTKYGIKATQDVADAICIGEHTLRLCKEYAWGE